MPAQRTVKRTWRVLSGLFSVVIYLGIIVGDKAQADTVSGIAWLSARLQPDGGFSSPETLTAPFAATVEALRTFAYQPQYGPSQFLASFSYLTGDPHESTQYLAQRILVSSAYGAASDDLVATLLVHLSRSGGYGEFPDSQPTVLDTARVAEALAESGQASRVEAQAAIDWLIDQQGPDGGWKVAPNQSSLPATAIVFRALWHYRHASARVPECLAKAGELLRSSRNAQGLWGEDFVSALALIALVPTLDTLDELAPSVAALAARQLADGSWQQDVYTTALAIRALTMADVPVPNPDLAQIAGSVIDGQTGQPFSGASVALDGPSASTTTVEADGVFRFLGLQPGRYSVAISQLGYSTVATSVDLGPGDNVDLGIIQLAPELGATNGVVRGTVTDVVTGAPISGVEVTASGVARHALTDTSGSYRIDDVPPATMDLQARIDGYLAATTTATLAPGGAVIFSPAMKPDVSAPGSAVLAGQVTNAETGLPLEGATITLSGAVDITTQTAADGSYSVRDLPAAEIQLRVSQPGFETLLANRALTAGDTLVFSPSLSPVSQQGAVIEGVVTETSSGSPLAGVTILLTGSTTASTVTGPDGHYRIDALAPGWLTISASLGGYVIATAQAEVTSDSLIRFSPTLSAEPSQEAGLTGVVLDASTGEALEAVSIESRFGDFSSSLITGRDGRFERLGLQELAGSLEFRIDGYVPVVFAVVLEAGRVMDLGQVRMRREEAVRLLPDLIIESIGRSQTSTSLDTLSISGVVDVLVANRGTAQVTSNAQVTVFVDASRDGALEPSVDVVLGSADVNAPIAVGDTRSVKIPVAGQLPFRDAPIHGWVDSAETVVELNEQNNVSSSSSACRIESTPTGDLSLKLKWQWVGSKVYGPVIVGQLSDDNGDGQIDGRDVPDLVFSDNTNHVRALSGADGSLLWVSSERVSLDVSGALADLDGDGLLEIVFPDSSSIVALDHNGEKLWRSSTESCNVGGWNASGIAIADLDSDGSPEIIHGRSVFDADGRLRWRGGRDRAIAWFGCESIAADVDLDGEVEVIAGRTLYGSDGRIKWHRGDLARDGFNAVGNFDADDHAEIVLSAGGKIYLLDDDSGLKWGPVSIPGGGKGGPPTVADFDGDGEPEIGVAGATYYAVFEGDGSLKWSTGIHDTSSSMTGSSVFDFEQDGRAEVVYADEQFFYIYDGVTGRTLVRLANGSTTRTEYPNVVDIDNDGQAEIIVTANNGGWQGVRVFESANGSWANTRSLWNQHSYHINNINDDGSVPRVESPSWLGHNTYRLNTFLDRHPLAAADLTASVLRLVDHGAGMPLSLVALVGNGGAIDSPAAVRVAFYQGDDAISGDLLGTVSLAGMAPGDFADVRLDDVTLEGTGNLRVIVDDSQKVQECDESNNAMSIPGDTKPEKLLGSVAVSTKGTTFGPREDVDATTLVTNLGSVSSDFEVQRLIVDSQGQVVQAFGTHALEALPAGESVALQDVWNTGSTLAGPYEVRAVLHDTRSQVIDEASADFAVLAPSVTVAASVTTDQPVYEPWDQVRVETRVENISDNSVQAGTQVELSITDPEGTVVYQDTGTLDQLLPDGIATLEQIAVLKEVLEGVYRIQVVVQDAVSHAPLALARTTFEVSHQSAGLAGNLVLEANQLDLGDPQTCTAEVINLSQHALDAQSVRLLLVDGTRGDILATREHSLDLPGQGSAGFSETFDTQGLPEGGYACLLQADFQGQWQTLEFAGFQLLLRYRIEGTLSVDPQGGRLLVLIDGDFPAGGDPHDPPSDPPTPAEQRSFLEALLTQAGWSYTLVTDADAFARELRSGGYTTYALLAEQVKLPELVASELREAIYRGNGLLVAGTHDNRNQAVQTALGLKLVGSLPKAAGIQGLDASLAVGDGAPFAGERKVLRIRPEGATVIGQYQQATRGKGKAPSAPEPALTRHTFGQGRSLFAGFDLLTEATQTGPEQTFARVLLAGLDQVRPEITQFAPGEVVPLHLHLDNLGIDAAGQAQLALPPGVSVVDPGDARRPDDTTLVWPVELVEGASADHVLWLRLPDAPEPVDLTVRVLIGEAPDWIEHRLIQLRITPELVPALSALRDTLVLRAAEDPAYEPARLAVLQAETALALDDPLTALQSLIAAADALAKIGTADAVSLRLTLARIIAEVERQRLDTAAVAQRGAGGSRHRIVLRSPARHFATIDQAA